MADYVVAVRLQGVKPTAVADIADAMGEGICTRVVQVEMVMAPEGWQAQMNVLVRDDVDLTGAVAYVALCTRRSIREAETPVARMALAATRE